tara:strand:- start:5539 stop:5997 length:459 start_codon:yes stop_codon:yes gene_type:complete
MKGPNLNITLISILFLLNSSISIAGEGKWKVLYEDDKLMIESKNVNCEYNDAFDQNYIFLKFSNLTEKNIIVSYYTKLWYNDECINCENKKPEFHKKFKIREKGFIESDCNEKQNQSKIFVKFSLPMDQMPGINKAYALTNFEITNIKIDYE